MNPARIQMVSTTPDQVPACRAPHGLRTTIESTSGSADASTALPELSYHRYHGPGTSSTMTARRTVLVAAMVLASALGQAQDCPELEGRFPHGPAFAVAVTGSFAYVCSGATLLVVDVSSPGDPNPVADAWDGVRVLDVADPSAPVEIAVYSPLDRSWGAWGITVVGSRAFVANVNAGVEILDLSGCTGALFADGFESGSTSAWSVTHS